MSDMKLIMENWDQFMNEAELAPAMYDALKAQGKLPAGVTRKGGDAPAPAAGKPAAGKPAHRAGNIPGHLATILADPEMTHGELRDALSPLLPKGVAAMIMSVMNKHPQAHKMKGIILKKMVKHNPALLK